MENISIVILASGKGSRMGYKTPKPLLKIGGISFIQQILNRMESLNSVREIIITESSEKPISKIKPLSRHPIHYAIQNTPNGPATALEAALRHISPKSEHILLLLGDAPLIQTKSIEYLVQTHTKSNNTITLLVGKNAGYIPFGKISFINDVYEFAEPSVPSNDNSLYSLGPIMFAKKELTSTIHELIESQDDEKRIEPVVDLYNTLNLSVGTCEVSIGNTLYWNINNRSDLYRARSL